MSTDLHVLSGAYALDALSEDELAEFEAHLAECAACREEVAVMQATLGNVGAAFEEAPPAGLKDRVLARVDRTPQDAPLRSRVPSADADASELSEGPVDELAARRAAPPWRYGVLATAATVAAVLVVGLSVLVANLNQRIDELETATSDMSEMLAAPDAQSLAAEGPDGSFARVVMSASRGEAMFLADGMDPAPHEHTYELWLIDDEGARSVGLFDVDDTGRVTHLLRGDMERAAAIGVTVEPEGGSPEPTTDPVMLIELEEA
jgi:anti-sigma-K factor RskA